ncbi:MAG: hypothetical protein ACK5WD_00770 [bacterium]
MPLARPVKFALVAFVLAALAVVAGGMIYLAAERVRLTNDPLALTSADEVRAACEVLIDRSLARGGSHIKSQFQLQVTLVALRDDGTMLERAQAHALLADLYDLIAARVSAPDAANREEMLALLSETRPTADNAALWDRYQQALAKHGIAAASN